MQSSDTRDGAAVLAAAPVPLIQLASKSLPLALVASIREIDAEVDRSLRLRLSTPDAIRLRIELRHLRGEVLRIFGLDQGERAEVPACACGGDSTGCGPDCCRREVA